MGRHIPYLVDLPIVGDIRPLVAALASYAIARGWPRKVSFLFKYDSRRRDLIALALSKDGVTSRLRALLGRHLGLQGPDVMVFSSHSMRRGGATALKAGGLSDKDIQTMGRWNSDAFKLCTESDLLAC